MRYMLLIHTDEGADLQIPKDQLTRMSADYAAYTEAMKKAGAFLGGERLQPARAAAKVSVRAGRTEVLDGPYAATKEQFGGYYIIEAPDLDQAIVWASRCPAAALGTVEVRPVWEMTVG
jgi:hypothetical protein